MGAQNRGFLSSSMLLFKSRLEIIIPVTWAATLASIIAGKGFPPLTEAFLSIIAVMMIVASVYIYNDITDRKMDAYSEQDKKKGRPIAHEKVSIANAKWFVGITGLTGLGICLILSPAVFIIGFTYYTLVFLYSHPRVHFKSMFIVKNLVTSMLFPVAFLLSGTAVEHRISSTTAFLATTYYVLTVLLLPAIADMLDYKEDLAFNVRTLGNTLSWKQNLTLFNGGLLVLIGGNILYFQLFDVNLLTPIVTSVIAGALMVYSYTLRNESGETASYKLRPVSYALVLMNPLLIALGIVF
jgi:4-hydroxybenzoate polyprenyltransferase